MKEISCSDIFCRDLHIGLEFMILAYFGFVFNAQQLFK